jgi:phosphohistidine phosphatase SixA
VEIKKNIMPDLIVSSPAVRAMETARIFAEEFGYPLDKIARRKALYDQSSNAIRSILREMRDSLEKIMIFGHNPCVSETAHKFVPDFHEEIPTAGVVTITFDVDSWKAITDGQGRCVDQGRVKKSEKSSKFKQLKKDLAAQLATRISEVFLACDKEITVEMSDKIIESGEVLARKFVKKLKARKKQSQHSCEKSDD